MRARQTFGDGVTSPGIAETTSFSPQAPAPSSKACHFRSGQDQTLTFFDLDFDHLPLLFKRGAIILPLVDACSTGGIFI